MRLKSCSPFRAYGTNYVETLRVQIHANCRIRRVYFSDRLYSEEELPAEFKLYLPVQNQAKSGSAGIGSLAHHDSTASSSGGGARAAAALEERAGSPIASMDGI